MQDAKDVFLEATSKSAGDVSPQALSDFGNLFIEKYNFTDALATFRDALAINRSFAPALLGLAVAQKSGGSGDVEESVRRALEVNPNLTGAMNLLAQLKIEEEDFDSALGQIQDHRAPLGAARRSATPAQRLAP